MTEQRPPAGSPVGGFAVRTGVQTLTEKDG